MNPMKLTAIPLSVATIFLAACGGSSAPEGGLSGTIVIDGSSTVYPLTAAVAEDFSLANRGLRIPVGFSGTGGGFKKFEAGETDISNASRPITTAEAEGIRRAGTDFIELPVAYDGLSVVVHPSNDWVDYLTVAELKMIWEPGSTVNRWNQVRSNWPDRPLVLYGAGTDSGTFDYFTEAVNGKSKASRTDFTASEDDNSLVIGVSNDVGALGFFGFSYYEENKSRLKIVPIDGGSGPVEPTIETIRDGSYAPLSRPVFIYTTLRSLDKPAVAGFVEYYLENAEEIALEVGFIPLPTNVYTLAKQRLANRVTGSIYEGLESTVSVSLEKVMSAE